MLTNLLYLLGAILVFLGVLGLLGVLVVGAGPVPLLVAGVILMIVAYFLANRGRPVA